MTRGTGSRRAVSSLSLLWLCGCLALVCGPAAAAKRVTEVWRSPFGAACSVSVNPTDGSCWAATGSSVMHLAADGTTLSQTNSFWVPQCVSVNSAPPGPDPGLGGSCWVADYGNSQVVHLSAAGTELWRGGGRLQARPEGGICS